MAGVEWRVVDDLSAAGPHDRVYAFDPRTGRIEFGDGHHGLVPPRGAPIAATYASGPHDGFTDFYAAMKAVDPTIAVGSCFNDDVFLHAMGTAHPYDFVVVHLYTGAPRHAPSLAAMGAWATAVPQMFAARLTQVRAAIDADAGPRAAAISIIVTEYNPLLRFRRAQLPINDLSLAQALDVADLLRIFAEQDIPVAAIHCLTSRGGTTLFAPPPDYTRRPASYALELFSLMAPERVATAVTGGDSYRFTYRDTDYQISYLTALAAYDPAGGRVTILVSNKHSDASIPVHIVVTGFDPAADGTIYTLTGPTLAATDTAINPDTVAITRTELKDAARSFVYHFPAHSVTLIELHRRTAAG